MKKIITLITSGLFVLLFISISSSALAKDFEVNTFNTDAGDADLTDGKCAATVGGSDCTLRAAIMQINDLGEVNNTIILPAETIVLTITGTGEDDTKTGDLDIKANIDIIGQGSANTTIDASAIDDRVFHELTGLLNTVNMTGFTIYKGGSANIDDGGSILNEGFRVNLTDIIITESTSKLKGGAIFNNTSGIISIYNSKFEKNTSFFGGAIYSESGQINTFNTEFSANNVTGSGGAIALYLASLSTESTTFIANQSYYIGGAIYAFASPLIDIQNTNFESNEVFLIGGAIGTASTQLIVKNSTFYKNIASPYSKPDYIPEDQNPETNCFDGFDDDTDGFVDFEDDECLTGVGGAIADIKYVEHEGDMPPPSSIKFINSTFANNNAYLYGGTMFFSYSAKVDFYNTTIAKNSADKLIGGIFNLEQFGSSIVNLYNSILSDNTAPGNPECYGDINSENYNVIGDTTDCNFVSQTNDILGTTAKLDDIADNGGPTQTLALQADSPAIDAGNPDGCMEGLLSILSTDQRGTFRPLDGNSDGTSICDSGAYEYNVSSPPPEQEPEPEPHPQTPAPTEYTVEGGALHMLGCQLSEHAKALPMNTILFNLILLLPLVVIRKSKT